MVQNEYIELLLELGVIGVALFVVIVVGLFRKTSTMKYIWAILVALLVQWWFFSGYPNALHVFLIFAFIYAYALRQKKTK